VFAEPPSPSGETDRRHGGLCAGCRRSSRTATDIAERLPNWSKGNRSPWCWPPAKKRKFDFAEVWLRRTSERRASGRRESRSGRRQPAAPTTIHRTASEQADPCPRDPTGSASTPSHGNALRPPRPFRPRLRGVLCRPLHLILKEQDYRVSVRKDEQGPVLTAGRVAIDEPLRLSAVYRSRAGGASCWRHRACAELRGGSGRGCLCSVHGTSPTLGSVIAGITRELSAESLVWCS